MCEMSNNRTDVTESMRVMYSGKQVIYPLINNLKKNPLR